MTSTFRLTRAEFKKIFKKPSVYIMAIFIVLTIFLSMYIFKPMEIFDNTISYGTNLNAMDYYNKFYNIDNNSTEIGINKVFDETDRITSYYINSNTRKSENTGYYDDVVNYINLIRNAKGTQSRENHYNSLKLKVSALYESFITFSHLEEYPHLKYTIEQSSFLTEYTKNIVGLQEAINKYDSYEIIEYWDSNNIESKLNSDLKNVIEYIPPTLKLIADDIHKTYNKFNEFYSDGSRYLSELEKYSLQLKNLTKKLDDYFDELIDNKDFPLVLIDKSAKDNIKYVLEESISALTSIDHTNINSIKFTDYTNLLTKLNKINYANFFTKTFNLETTPVKQVSISLAVLEDNFETVKEKVNKNRDAIKKNINKLKDNESSKEIQFKITEYYLLSETYKDYINDTIINHLSEQYPSHEFEKMHLNHASEFNKYQITERLTTNRYYIDNNVYSNSFNNNFSFGQNSSTKGTNVYDFMYFTMELCTIIIIVFSMLLIVGLIAGESDSGTMKLLLVRPFRRSKIVTAKLMATIFFVITFMIFSALISFAGGYFTFGYTTTPILVVFNASSTIVMNPLVLMILNIISLIFDVIFFVLIALMISTIFKNHAASIYISLLFVILVYVFNILFANSFWYSFLPGMNLHLFKYLGNGFMFEDAATTVLHNVLITPIQSTMNFLYSALINVAYSMIAIAVSYTVFRRRDF